MRTLEATRSDDGATLRVAVGDRVALRLPENAGTGYLWTLDEADGVRVVDDRREQPADAGAGATGLRVLELAVDEPGAHELHLRLQRPWEPASSAVDEMTLAVEATSRRERSPS